MTTNTQPAKTAERNRKDVATNAERQLRAYTLIKELAEQKGYLDRGPYLSGLDEMLDELEGGIVSLILEKQPQE